MEYHLEEEYFQGPFSKLLELVQERKLDVTLVSLSAVTDEFLRHIKTLEKTPDTHGLLADFLVVASRLLLIKSKVLLPELPLNEEEEGDIRDIEQRMQLYNDLKGSSGSIRKVWSEVPFMWKREFLQISSPVFFPPHSLTAQALHSAVSGVLGELQKVLRPAVTLVKEEVIHLQEKISHILDRIRSAPLKFKDLKGSGSKKELVVLFLAILHLVKDQLASVEQTEHFGDIHIQSFRN